MGVNSTSKEMVSDKTVDANDLLEKMAGKLDEMADLIPEPDKTEVNLWVSEAATTLSEVSETHGETARINVNIPNKIVLGTLRAFWKKDTVQNVKILTALRNFMKQATAKMEHIATTTRLAQMKELAEMMREKSKLMVQQQEASDRGDTEAAAKIAEDLSALQKKEDEMKSQRDRMRVQVDELLELAHDERWDPSHSAQHDKI